MSDYKEFEAAVLRHITGDRWLHILPSVPADSRQRFLLAVQGGVALPQAYDLILVSKQMTDNEFAQKLRDITIP